MRLLLVFLALAVMQPVVFAQLSQKEADVIVTTDHEKNDHVVIANGAKAAAIHLAPYAMLAAKVYSDKLTPIKEIDGKLIQWEGLKFYTHHLRDLWFGEWRETARYKGGECKANDPICFQESGFEAHIYHRKNCSEVVVAFRGSDFDSINDWKTNARWLLPFPHRDQMKEVAKFAPQMLAKAIAPCKHKGDKLRVVATGHSLGASLATMFAYNADTSPVIAQDDGVSRNPFGKRVDHVYAFNSSPVTGYTDNLDRSRRNARGLRIDRIYEKNEVLAYLRGTVRVLSPPTMCDPQIRMVRFNFDHDFSIMNQHGMLKLSSSLILLAQKPSKKLNMGDYLQDSQFFNPVTKRCMF
jgi:Lipase (class 3)